MDKKVLLTKVESWYIDNEFYPAPVQGGGFGSVVQTIWEPVEMYFDDDDTLPDEVTDIYLRDMYYAGTERLSA